MAIIYRRGVAETTTTTGTGTLTLAGAVGNRHALSVLGDGARVRYRLRGSGNVNEEGIGTYTLSGTTLSREVLLWSTTGSLISLSGTTLVDVVDHAHCRDLNTKVYCHVATTGPGTLSSSFEAGDTVDGEILEQGWNILIKDQASGVENGVYVVNASGAPTRHSVAASGTAANFTAMISSGARNQNRNWIQSGLSKTIGTDAMVFEEFLKPELDQDWVTITDAAGFVIDWQAGRQQQVTLGANRSPSFAGAQIGQSIRLKIGASGAYSMTWPAGLVWPGGSAPTQTATASKYDEYIIEKLAEGVYAAYTIALNVSTTGMV